MSYASSASKAFLSTVNAWIETTSEVLVLFRHSASAGAKDFEFFSTTTEFQRRLAELPSRTCVIVFRDKQLPIRGPASPELVSAALALVPEREEWLAVALKRKAYGKASWFHHEAGQTHAELREELAGHTGELMAVGRYPPWLEDSEAVVSAVVPEQDGSVVTGVY